MRSTGRRGLRIFFLIFGISLIALAVALQVGWILLNYQQIALLIFGIVFFSLIITGLILNTTFLLREIRLNEQQDAFLNAVTHELKTPIASIRLYLETLKSREVAPEKRAEFYDVMLSDSDRLLSTVEQILVASRTRERKRKLNITNIELGRILSETAERISMRYHLAPDTIAISENGRAIVRGDPDELRVVFINLIDNAVKYSPENPQVKISFAETARNLVETRIEDKGIGIARNELKQIFERFYRAPDKHSTAKGTGLGLFIVRSIVERHGGKVFAESAGEGKGSAFVVQLPRAQK
jgi:signal transduction histidine kinase